MTGSKPHNALTFAVVVITVSGCATFRDYTRCAAGECPDDARIATELKSRLDQQPDLAANVHVQTLNSVVYLSGQVTTAMQRDSAEFMAHEVTGVRRIIDNVVATADSGR